MRTLPLGRAGSKRKSEDEVPPTEPACGRDTYTPTVRLGRLAPGVVYFSTAASYLTRGATWSIIVRRL
ncbi:hypothetical protein SBA3_520014 [Candidatus Sulfopaludibacter sp. SbA3]|nr:hypothetical protein SBA3_520014 [Candidatus Sulfopaludibacter sp. SbA3]